MRRIAFISCVVLAVIVASAQQYNVPFRPRAAAGGGAFCDGTFQFCDEFGSDTIANYTPANGSTGWAISGGVANGPTAGNGGLLYSTNTTTTDQYVIIRWVSGHIDGDTGVCMGTDNSSTDSDLIYYSSGFIWWGTGNTGCGFLGDTAHCAIPSPSANDYWAIKKTGTSTTRVVEVWVTTTQPTGPPTGTATCTFTGGNPTPTFTSPATSAGCDQSNCTPTSAPTGQKVGLFAGGASPVRQFDNFAGGSP